MKVEYVPRDKMPCDFGSRHPEILPENLTRQEREEIGIETEEEDMEIWVARTLEKVLPAITLKEMVEATKDAPELSKLVEEKKTGRMSKETSK